VPAYGGCAVGPMVLVRAGAHDEFMCPPPAGRDESPAMSTPDLRWQLAATGASRAPQARAPWQRVLTMLRAPAFAVALGLVAALVLLLIFRNVVAGIVVQGDLRRASVVAALSSPTRIATPLAPVHQLVKASNSSSE
jgi:hypothetical protein